MSVIINLLDKVKITALGNELFINDKSIAFKNRISDLCIGDNFIIVSLFEENTDMSKQPRNNAYCYDFKLNFKWNIHDILHKNTIICNIDYFSKEQLAAKKLVDFDLSKAIDNHHFLVCNDDMGIRYIIDLDTLLVIDEKGFRF